MEIYLGFVRIYYIVKKMFLITDLSYMGERSLSFIFLLNIWFINLN